MSRECGVGILGEATEVDRLARRYAGRLLQEISKIDREPPRTFGFEYEFLPAEPLTARDMTRLRRLLRDEGFTESEGRFVCDERAVVFEPGGQIEYLSPPMEGHDESTLLETMGWISGMNAIIRSRLGIRYLGRPFLAGRETSPLLLTADRYRSMHRRFAVCDDRGLQMMKGTAAVHLHAALMRPGELAPLWLAMTDLSCRTHFSMSEQRRDIWNRTDPRRCGLPAIPRDALDPMDILVPLCRLAVSAVELSSGVPFYALDGVGFPDFLEHLTTIFTDVRLNLKGMTVELRTPDSLPPHRFPTLWRSFIEQIEERLPR
ncbi:hypothetical protein GF402_01685 [Candidatus Fermentibacteria bacterium]|nr:hypothetical protein [Candidatus Fermentibacteria bacterium]